MNVVVLLVFDKLKFRWTVMHHAVRKRNVLLLYITLLNSSPFVITLPSVQWSAQQCYISETAFATVFWEREHCLRMVAASAYYHNFLTAKAHFSLLPAFATIDIVFDECSGASNLSACGLCQAGTYWSGLGEPDFALAVFNSFLRKQIVEWCFWTHMCLCICMVWFCVNSCAK